MTRLPRPPPSSPQPEKVAPAYVPHREEALPLKHAGTDDLGWMGIAQERGMRVAVLKGALLRLRTLLQQHAWEETPLTTREVRVIFEALPPGWMD